jgi:DNA-binding NarL/FixJ family response regulator/Zn finger protein HypA/HybF involved in hydrogenase expression
MISEENYRKIIFSSIQRAKELITSENLSTDKDVRLQLKNEIEKIVSASTLENQIELSVILERLKAASKEILSGTLSIDNIGNPMPIFFQALTDLEEVITDEGKEMETQFQEPQEFTIKPANYHQQPQSAIVKKLKVLCIDSDETAQMKLKRNLENEVGLVSCTFPNEARIVLNGNERFDAVICSLSLSNDDMLELIKEISGNLPVIATSNADDPDVIQTAVMAGAIDYIIKNDTGIKWMARSLHTAIEEWKKKFARPDKQAKDVVLENPYARQILQDMLQNLNPLRQQIHPILTIEGLHGTSSTNKDSSDIQRKEEALGLLESDHYVIKNHIGLTIACPTCKSPRVAIRYLCPSCSASNFMRGNVLEHSKCGYAGFEASFSAEKNTNDERTLVCPKCRKQLRLIGVDYFKTESAYKCKECNNIFSLLEQRLSCIQCGHSNFKLSQAGWQSLYEYRISNEKLDKLKIELTSLDKLQKFLVNNGFKVYRNHKIKTRSQSFGPFDLVAERHDEKVFVIKLSMDMNESMFKVLDLDYIGKMSDGNIRKFAVIFSEANDMILNTLKKFDISAISGESEESIVRDFQNILSQKF